MSDLSRLNDAIGPLVERAQAGDPESFDALVRQCHQQIYRWALVQTGDSDDAEDVTQEVLVRLYTSLGRYRARSRFTTWLFQVTRNAAAEFHRRRKSRRRAIERHQIDAAITADAASRADRAAADAASGHDGEVAGIVRGFLHALPARQREIFDLVDLQDHAPVEVAEMLEMNPVTVRAHLFRARRTIRSWLMERHPELVEEYGR